MIWLLRVGALVGIWIGGFLMHVAVSRLRHRHCWRETARTYTAPPAHLRGEGFCGLQMVQQVMFGLTNVEYRCDCGDHRFETIPGKATSTWTEDAWAHTQKIPEV